jgi:predicted O-linked N-acetylglucosamine transferase (SPINDLY family)
MNTEKEYIKAFTYYQSGNLQQAEHICKKILHKYPQHLNALNMLGAISYQLRKYDAASKYLQKVVELDPNHADAYSNLGNVLQEQGKLDEAMICIEKSIHLNAGNAEGYNTMGMILHKRGEIDKAIEAYHRAVQINPTFAYSYHNLGVALKGNGLYNEALHYFQKALHFDPLNADACLHTGMILKEKGRPDEAISFLQKAVHINPELSSAYHGLGLLFGEKRQFDQAIVNFGKAIELNPDYADAYSNVGKILQDQGMLDDAMTYYRKAIQLDSHHALAYSNLGAVLQTQGKTEEAIAHFQKALQLNPDFADAYYNLGTVFQEGKNLDGAISCFRKAITLNPRLLVAYNNLGNTLSKQGKLQEAVETFRQALEQDPSYALALNNLGNVLKDQGQLHDAEASCRKAFDLQPDFYEAYSNFLLFMNYNASNNAQTIFSEHMRLGKQVSRPFSSHYSSFSNDNSPDRKLRIGYISPDFRQHSVAYYIEPVIKEYDPERFEVFCYTSGHVQDEVTERIRNYADHWRDITRLNDNEAVRLIHEDKIDILVDLAGHTGSNRILLFARKPAPVQVTWIGYPATTGLPAMDYKIVDSYTDPPGETDHYYTEELIRMPEGFLCYLPPADCPEITPPPALSTGNTCFGSFNNFSKVSFEVVKLWISILRSVPNATLLLKAKCFSDEQTRRYAQDMFSRADIDSDRISLIPWEMSTHAHLDLYNRVDIALDTFPYNGTTTTCEALYMGVPVITLAGNTHASRVGVSILSNIGLPELIAQTSEEYISKAVDLAHDLEKLRSLRISLRGIMSRSPLTDAKKFTRHLEEVYRNIWAKWCDGIENTE